jgi:HEAT repeat protein
VIEAEVVVATVALCSVAAGFVAAGVSPHIGRRSRRSTGGDAEMRQVLFRAIDEGDLDPATLEELSAAQRKALETQAQALLPSLRGEDRDALGRLLDRLGTVDAARRRAHSKRAVVRAEAGEFLGESGTPEAVADLLVLLKDPDPKVRWSAARGLGRLGDPKTVPVLLGSLEGDRSVPVDVVADAVFGIRDCPVALLRDGLHSPSVPSRALTVELLGRFQALAAADEVIQLLGHDPSVEVRARAARALGRMGSPRATSALLSSVDEGPVAMRAQAVWALGEIGAPEALPVLRATVMGPSRHMVELAAAALAAIGPPGIAVLVELAAGDGASAAGAARALAAQPSLQAIA